MVFAPLIGLTLLLGMQTPGDEALCNPRPMPHAIDQLDSIERTRVVSFAATPSLEHPGRAWVVRVSQTIYQGPANLEIVRLRRQSGCNRYVVERRWQASVSEAEFSSLLNRVLPTGLPSSGAFLPDDPLNRIVGLDGTTLELRLQTPGWEVTRRMHGSGPDSPVSAIFYQLVSEHVDTSELPSPEWRSPPTD